MRFSIVPLVAGLIVPQGIACAGNQKPGPSDIEHTGERSRPNIIIVITDDQGYSDLGCYGGEMHTPVLDRLASEGILLTHFYNSAMCIASRAALMTGNYSVSSMPGFKNMPVVTEYLQEAGYRNALIGKWHLPGDPMDRGFDHFFGFLGGFADHFTGGPDFRLDRTPFKDFGDDYFSTDAFTDRAVQFIESIAESADQSPFFLLLSYQAPHNPLQAPRDDIMRHRGKYLEGWQAIREARFTRQKELGIVPEHAALPAYPENLPGWESLSPEQQDLEDLRMAVYAAMIEGIDQGVGKVISTLEELGMADDTFLLFMSDNGTDSFSVMDTVFLDRNILPGDRASNWQPGTGWAYATVTPWRLYKISQHGGGVTTGAIAWWPSGITGQKGRIDQTLVHKIDLLPTFMDIINHPAGDKAISGESFYPLLKGQTWQRPDPLFFQFADNRAIRTAEWTLVEVDDAGWELFHTPTDPFEDINLASEHPGIVKSLSEQWLNWYLTESGKETYIPQSTKDNPHYKPQGDRGSGVLYTPSAMPEHLKNRYIIER